MYSGLLPNMEVGHVRLNSHKPHICLGKNMSMEIKDNEDLNKVPKSH